MDDKKIIFDVDEIKKLSMGECIEKEFNGEKVLVCGAPEAKA